MTKLAILLLLMGSLDQKTYAAVIHEHLTLKLEKLDRKRLELIIDDQFHFQDRVDKEQYRYNKEGFLSLNLRLEDIKVHSVDALGHHAYVMGTARVRVGRRAAPVGFTEVWRFEAGRPKLFVYILTALPAQSACCASRAVSCGWPVVKRAGRARGVSLYNRPERPSNPKAAHRANKRHSRGRL